MANSSDWIAAMHMNLQADNVAGNALQIVLAVLGGVPTREHVDSVACHLGHFLPVPRKLEGADKCRA